MQRGLAQQIAHRGDPRLRGGRLSSQAPSDTAVPIAARSASWPNSRPSPLRSVYEAAIVGADRGRHDSHHGAGAVLLAMPGQQPCPELVVAGRPATGLAPLRQRLGPGKRARLVAQHVEVVLQVQHVLAAAMAALVSRHPVAGMPKLDMQRFGARLHPAARTDRHRVGVGLDNRAARLLPPVAPQDLAHRAGQVVVAQ